MHVSRGLYYIIMIWVVILLSGVILFKELFDMTLLDAFYNATVTMTTLGSRTTGSEVLNDKQKLFISLYAIFATGIYTFTIVLLFKYLYDTIDTNQVHVSDLDNIV